MPDIGAIAGRVPEWQGTSLAWEPLPGGYSHRVYLVTAGERRYVLRILNEEINANYLGIPAQQELHNTVAAAASGAAPAVYHTFPDVPALVLEYVDGVTMSAESVRRPSSIDRAAHALRLLHERSDAFCNRFSIFRQLDDYLELRERVEWPMPEHGDELVSLVQGLEAVLDVHGLPLRPCHNDLVPENLIDSDAGIRIIDFQVGGMNDPSFDLADLAADSDLDPDQLGRLCAGYFGEVNVRHFARTWLFLLAARLTWGLWFAVHAGVFPETNESGGYWREAQRRWTLLERDVATTDLGRTIAQATAS
jgi:thiamine kinase-like enzyme